jgi:aminoglycoside phosphotransferase (APT) family kinase protein
VLAAAAVSSSAASQVFRLMCGGRTVFLKVAAAADVQREAGVLELARSLGVPVPEIVAADAAGTVTGTPCVLLSRVRGRPSGFGSPAFTLAGPVLRAVHEVTLPGYGLVVASPRGLRGGDPTWAESVRLRTANLTSVADGGLVDPRLLDRAAAAVLARKHLLATPFGSRLLHGDLHPRHVYGRDGVLTAIIDWADASCGSPAFDLGRILHSATMRRQSLRYGFSVLRRFLDSYGDAPWLGAGLTESLLLHATVFVLWAMRCEHEGGSPWAPWWPAQAATLTRLVDELGRG